MLPRQKDFYAGGLMVLVGLGAALESSRYQIGSMLKMGPGYVPTVIGLVLAGVGGAIAAPAMTVGPPKEEVGQDTSHLVGPAVHRRPQWRAWLHIISGVIAFIVFGSYAGLAPAIFSTVFISAMGDREATWTGAVVLAAGMTVGGSLLFSYGLRLSFPRFRFW